MSKQRYVNDSFWTDPYVEGLDPSEKLLFLYFLTNPLCNVAGMYEIRNNRVAYETGFEKDMVDKIKKRFISDGKLLCVDDWIIITNFAKNQSPNPNVIKGMQRIIDELPDKVKALKGFESLSHFTLLNLTLPNLTKDASKDAPFDLKEYIKELRESNQKHLELIGFYMHYRFDSLKNKIKTKKQAQSVIKRHLRPAKQLLDWDDEQISQAVAEVSKKNSDIDWTLETVYKHLTK